MARQQRMQGVAQNERLCKPGPQLSPGPQRDNGQPKIKNPRRAVSIDKQGGKIAFVCDVCSARFEAEATNQQSGKVHELWTAAEKLGWHVRQQRGGKWHTACPQCATDDWKLWNW